MLTSIGRPHTSLPPRRCPHRDQLPTPIDTLRLVTDIPSLPFGIAHLADPMRSGSLFPPLWTLGVAAPFTSSIVRVWSI
ncbi:hypothetical protein AURDEDRAFT_172689 [Auricularia subglabra TFB-10046 SS5]|nr:hypothetical protein AURDEDRAFT_172689 [Auricularia subglabra TFB-10046 SS5]